MTAVDQAVRDRAVRETQRSFTLSAGAGSGKTSVLTARVLALLRRGVPPARIAAITFTEKAAGELQGRVRDALEGALARDDDPVLRQALEQLPELQLSTIHAFCQRLLGLEALEAGWAPDTELLPDLGESPGARAAWAGWQAGFRARAPEAAFLVATLVNPTTLREAAFRLLAFRDLGPQVSPLRFTPEARHRALQEVHQGLVEALAGCKAPASDKLVASNRALLDAVAACDALPAGEAVRRALLAPVKAKKSGGRAADWVPGGKATFIDAAAAFDAWRATTLERLHAVLVDDLATHFLPRVAEAKAQRAIADFDDLLHRAAALLGADAPRARLARRFDALLVDEVQDTDPIQAEVAALLARAPDATGPWQAHPPRPGGLFAVGDARQSIYRFRRADVATWQALEALIARDGEPLALEQNFRSVPGIVAWVNATFADLPGYAPQVAYRGPAALDPVVRVDVPSDDDDDELEAVARYLLHLKATGEVTDRATGRLRPLRWADVMLLLPAWSKADRLQAGLTRAGIPCQVEGGSAFAQRDEVRVALAALKALDEPGDAEATVLALRGLFGLDWATLAAHHAAGGTWRATVPEPPPGPVADAFRVLAEHGRQRGRRPWAELLDSLLDATGAAAVWATLLDGEARLANLDKLRALLRKAEGGATGPSEVLRTVAALDGEKDLSRNDLDSDAVRITSYFKAKGLEAPVVVLPMARRSSQGVQAAIDRATRSVALKVGDLRPPGWADAEAAEKEAEQAERARWMYVAATRARDQLVVLPRKRSHLVDQHLAAGLDAAVRVDADALPEVAWRDATFPGHDEAVDGWLAAPDTLPDLAPDPTEAWQAARLQAIRRARSASTRYRSVQEVAARERVAHADSPVGVDGGRVVHEVLESLDLALDADALDAGIGPRVDAAAFRVGLDPALRDVVVDIVRRILRHPVLDEARAAPERWVEVPFALHDQGRVVSGRIDLAFPVDATRRRWKVVDWKSDLPARGTAAWRNYERQLGWYAQALLATVSPCEHVDTVLVGPHPDLGPPAAPADLLAEALPELAPGLQALLDRGAPAPSIGADLGEPIVATAELAFDDARVALLVAQPDDDALALEALGWTVLRTDAVGVAWAEHALEAVASALGLPA